MIRPSASGDSRASSSTNRAFRFPFNDCFWPPTEGQRYERRRTEEALSSCLAHGKLRILHGLGFGLFFAYLFFKDATEFSQKAGSVIGIMGMTFGIVGGIMVRRFGR